MSHIPFPLVRQSGLYHNGAFHTLALHLTADLIGVVDAAMELICICHASSAAVKSGKAFPASVFGVYAAASELICDLRIYNALIYISHKEFFLPHKLVARVEIAPRRNREILCAGTAA